MCSADIFLGLLAILFPPLPVWVKCGICSADSLINILLCVLGFIPGLLHSWYIIAKFPEPTYEYQTLQQEDREGGRSRQPKPTPVPSAQPNYGTASNGGTASSSAAPAPAAQENGEGSNGPPPPTYAEVVADHKVQTRD